jgi:hypothetical protein
MVAWTLVHAKSSWQTSKYQIRLREESPRHQFVWTKVHTPDASAQSNECDVRNMADLSGAFIHFFRTL